MIRSIPTGVTTDCRAPTDGVSSSDLLGVTDCVGCPNDLPPRRLAPKPPTRPLRRPSWPWQGTLRPRRSNGDVHAFHSPPQASQPPLALPSRSSTHALGTNIAIQDLAFHLAPRRPTPRRAYPPPKPVPSQLPKSRRGDALAIKPFRIWDAVQSSAPPSATSIADKSVAQARPPRPGV